MVTPCGLGTSVMTWSGAVLSEVQVSLPLAGVAPLAVEPASGATPEPAGPAHGLVGARP
ncbi:MULTISPECIES: hypothetical protein [unclassified Streptomyces]|uniref:hypothetical protein n=1 Tax=unclassified Streptomyces TaxID=2593676 RepID=UPI0027413381|nr:MULTISPECIES: hypothetical protein [unclassified Streptomyces]